MRPYQEEKLQKSESTPKRHEDLIMDLPETPQEVETYKPEPDTIRVSKAQESPAKR